MSDSAQGLSRKIAGATDLQGVVRSMKALAASSITQYERAVGSLDDYYRTVELGLSACFRTAGPAAVPVKQVARQNKSGAVIFGSDQGLVGGFNEVVVDFATSTLAAMPGKLKRLWPVGDRARALLSDTGLTSDIRFIVPNSVNAITSLRSRNVRVKLRIGRSEQNHTVFPTGNAQNDLTSGKFAASEQWIEASLSEIEK